MDMQTSTTSVASDQSQAVAVTVADQARTLATATLADAKADPTTAVSREEFARATGTLIAALMKVESLSAADRENLDAALACYSQDHNTDAARKVWVKIAKKLDAIHDRFRVSYTAPDDGAIVHDNGPAGAAYRAAIAAAQPGAGQVAALLAQIGVERFAKHLATNVYGNYAVDPSAVPELSRRIARVQEAARRYSTDYAPVLSLLGMEIAFFDGSNADADLADIIAEASELAEAIGPAQDAFNDANEAWVRSKDKTREDALKTRQDELQEVWSEKLDRFFDSAQRILDLPVTTSRALARNIDAYAELVRPVVGEEGYETALEALPKENLVMIIERLMGADAVSARLPEADQIHSAQMERLWQSARDEFGKATAEHASAHAASSAARQAGAGISVLRALDTDLENRFTVWEVTGERMYAAPAPDLEALAFKLGVFLSDYYENRQAIFPDPARVQALVDGSDINARAIALIYLDAARLAGRPVPPAPPPGITKPADGAAARPEDGSAESDPAPDPTSPLGVAIAERERLRRERDAWEDANGDDTIGAVHKLAGKAEFAVYAAPASSVAEIRWKLLEDVMEAKGLWSHKEAAEYLEAQGGLDGASQSGILSDLEALAELRPPSFAADADFLKATARALDLIEEANTLSDRTEPGADEKSTLAADLLAGLLADRAQTLAGAVARARMVELHMPGEGIEGHDTFERRLVRALIGDLKALYLAQPCVGFSGRDEFKARWIAARIAAYLKGDTTPATPRMAA